jgi:hypothetical protein
MLIDFPALNDRVAPVAVLNLLGLKAKRVAGDIWRRLCPFCGAGGKGEDAFCVNLKRGIWYCHGCEETGDMAELYARVTDQRIYWAALEMASRLGVVVPYQPPT